MVRGWKLAEQIVIPLILLAPRTTWSEELPTFCGSAWPLDELLVTLRADDASVNARLVFVTFPDIDEDSLPTWADDMRTDLIDFIDAMSRGQQQLNLTILTRPAPNSDLAWMADFPASDYRDDPGLVCTGMAAGSGYGVLNTEIMRKIAETIPNAWEEVDEVFIVHYQCAFANCGVSGTSSLCLQGPVDGFDPAAGGTTSRMHYGPSVPFNGERNREQTKYVAGHEYGHRIGLSHSPGSDEPTDDPDFVNYGRYDMMRHSAGGVFQEGLLPYHPLQLVENGWLPELNFVTTDIAGLRVPDVLGEDAQVYEIIPPIPDDLGQPFAPETFVVVNYQRRTSYDDKYLNKGLLIWHRLRDPEYRHGIAWDLESAAGKFAGNPPDPAQPDPESGRDPLEASPLHNGSAEDFFDGSPSNFDCMTNPHTYLYFPVDYESPQDLKTWVAFENIRPADDGTGDMLVDVYVTPKQKVLSPNGGEELLRLNEYPIRWEVRPSACATTVDVLLSPDDGSSYVPLALGEPNDGEFLWYPDHPGTFRIVIKSYDENADISIRVIGEDESDGSFTVIAPLCPVLYQRSADGIVETNNILSRSFQFGQGGARRTSDLLILPEATSSSGPQYFELREAQDYYSAVDAAELQVFDVAAGTSIVSTADARPLAVIGQAVEPSNVLAIAGLPLGTELLPSSMIHGTAGTIVEYGWNNLPPTMHAVVLVEASLKPHQVCEITDPENCDEELMTDTGRISGTGLLVQQRRGLAWEPLRDLVPRVHGDRVALELPGSLGGALRIRVLWEGTHNFRMIGWVAVSTEIDPSFRLEPRDVHHSGLGNLGSILSAVDGIPALLSRGEVISFAFDAPPLRQGWERHLALLFNGTYSNRPDGLRLRGALRKEKPGVLVPRKTAIAISGSTPFNPATAWKLNLASGAPVNLRVYDPEGRLVRQIVEQELPAGMHTISWNGRNELGQVVPSGVYFWRFDGAGLHRSEKFVILK